MTQMNLKRTTYDWIVESIAICSLIAAFYPLIYLSLGYSTEQSAGISSFWAFPLLSLLVYIGMSIAERYYPRFNYPVKVTETNANRLYKLALRLLRAVKCTTILLFAYINIAKLCPTYFYKNGLNAFIVTALITVFIYLLAYYITRMMRLKHK